MKPDWLAPLVERWNIDDDGEREKAVEALDDRELFLLAHSLDDIEDEFWDALTGAEDRPPEEDTPEYHAMVVFGMTVDHAKVALEQREARRYAERHAH